MTVTRNPFVYVCCALFAGMVSPYASASKSGILSELKFGIIVHDINKHHDATNSIDVNAELDFSNITVFDTQNRILRFILSPRPMIGFSINTNGDTHYGYAGLNWEYEFENGIFISPTFGLAVHTGNLYQRTRPCTPAELADGCAGREPVGRIYIDYGKPRLGARVLFRESIELGYRFSGGHSLSVFAAHLSQGGIFDKCNDGMNFVGIRYGYAFNSW